MPEKAEMLVNTNHLLVFTYNNFPSEFFGNATSAIFYKGAQKRQKVSKNSFRSDFQNKSLMKICTLPISKASKGNFN